MHNPATAAVGEGLVPAASVDRPFLRSPDSPWDILGAFGFLLSIGALGLLWRTWKAHVALLETIEKLDGKMKQQKKAHETSNLSRKTEIAKLDESNCQLQEVSSKLQGGLDGYQIAIPQLRRDVNQLIYYCHSVEVRLKQLKSGSPGAGALGESNLLASDSMAEASGLPSIPSESTAEPDVPNIDDCIAALNRGDKSLLRSKAAAELNITPESEDALERGSTGLNTRLKDVTGGGSYLLIERDAKYWLLPTVQTLSSFLINPSQKGIFDYVREPVTVPELICAAELAAVEGTWEVVRKGKVIVPT